MSWRTPVLSRLAATLVALVASVASALLVGFNALVVGLTCGEDGSLDYGTGGTAARNYCQALFDDSGHFSGFFISLSILAFAVAGVTAMLLIATQHRLWLYSSLTLVSLLGAWAIWLVVFL